MPLEFVLESIGAPSTARPPLSLFLSVLRVEPFGRRSSRDLPRRDASRESRDVRWKGARWKGDRDVMTRAFIPRASPRYGEMMR
mmetsp:Transcript_48595/g.157499  ORF Transcript_48595/g.157499 Transcript_48595/m.157499 type:complete len:84 (+) Transcript_48595:706-957(+)